jgi:carbamoyltransferase
MGLSSYGDWKIYYDKMREIVDFNDKDIFTINNNLVRFRTKDFSELEKLFSIKRRKKEEEIEKPHMHIAAALQKISEQAILRCMDFAEKKLESKYLCLSGGVMLNCPANESTFQLFPLKDIFIPSGSQDAGTAIGAAFYIWNQMLGKKRSFVYNHAYWGPSYSDIEIKKVLEECKIPFKKVKEIEKQTAKLVSEGNIVAWFQGRIEVGPRALGNRSILVDPRRKEMVNLVNQKVKKREWFRPFAPSVLAERAHDFFYIRKVLTADRFMLFAVLPKYPEKIPAVVHVDGTCRIQAVRKQDNPRYHKMIKEFESITGIPVVLNTSFNVQEPIVCSPKEAVNTFLKTDMDYLAIGDYLVKNRK